MPSRGGWCRMAALVSSYLATGALAGLHHWLPSPGTALFLRPSLVATGVLLLVWLAGAFARGRRSRAPAAAPRWPRRAAAVFLAFHVLYSAGEALTRYAFQRPFAPLSDLAFVPGLLDLVARGTVFTRTAVYVPLVLLLVVGLTALLAAGLRPWVRGRWAPPALLAVAAAVGVAWGFAEPLGDEVLAQLRGRGDGGVSAPPPAAAPTAAPAGRDVLLFVVESYGSTVFTKPAHREPLLPVIRRAEERLAAAGYHMISRYLTSPVIGGWSWLADASLLTGRWIDTQAAYDELLAGQATSLPRVLGESGYRTLLVAPGTVHGPWDEGLAFFGYHEDVNGWEFGYSGPDFSFVPVPDQYAIGFVHDRYVAAANRGPLLAIYTLVSSHAPFNHIPAYIPDWNLGDGSLYHHSPNRRFANNWVRGEAYDEGFAAAIDYEWTVLSEYLARFVTDDSLVVIVGDHQPKYPITARGSGRGVPIHVLCRDAGLLAPIVARGYGEGLVPPEDPAPPGLDRFWSDFFAIAGPRDSRDQH